jgi:hypothetical protein
MEQVARLIDADVVSLSARVRHAVERAGSDCSVTRFTYWYTGRPPVHEALVLRPGQPSSSVER